MIQVLEKLGFKTLGKDSEETDALIARAYELLIKLRDGKLGEFDAGTEEQRILNQIALPPKGPRRVDVEEAYTSITDRRKLDKMQVPALVSIPVGSELKKPKLSTKDLALEIERIRARVLLVCLDLTERNYQSHIVMNCSRAVRQIISGDHPVVLNMLPSFDATMLDIADNLTSILNLEEDTLEQRKLYAIQYAFRKFRPEEKPEPPGGSGKRTFNAESVAQPESYSDSACDMAELVDSPPDVRSAAQAELQHDQIQSKRTLKIKLVEKGEYKRELVLSERRATGLARALSMRESLPRCSIERLTDYQVRTIISDCYKRMIEGCCASTVILAMLMLGRRASAILDSIGNIGRAQKIKVSDGLVVRSGHIMLAIRIPLPSHSSKNYRGLTTNQNNAVFLRIPATLSKHLLALKDNNKEKLDGAVRARMTELGKPLPIQVTGTSLSTHLFASLITSRCDTTTAAIISGNSPQQFPGIFYRSTDTSGLASTHENYIHKLLKEVSVPDTFTAADLNSGKAGSRLQAKTEVIAKCFNAVRKRIQLESRRTTSCWYRFHNDFVLYSYMIFSVATGHRPVNSPFELTTDLCDESGELWISDKENRLVDSGTLIVLPEIARRQWTHYREHLKTLRTYCGAWAPEIAAHIEQILRGKAPQLFFISVAEHNSPRHELQTHRIIKPNTNAFEERLKDILPIPLNWPRHKLSTLLAKPETTRPLIDVFMRHEGFGRSALGPYSGYSMWHKRQIASVLDRVLREYFRLKEIFGWSRTR